LRAVATEDPDEHAIGYQVLPRGVPVEAADGTRVGTFHKAIHHHREHMLDGVVMETDDGRVFVDAPEIARITNKRVILTVDTAAIADFPRYRSLLGRRLKG
jgi:hypothetical protein